jgi:hypothetical protein
MIFLMVGFAPKQVFLLLREHGGVVTQTAITNNEIVITVAFCAYITAFVHQKCLQADGVGDTAAARASFNAVFAGILAFVAFLPLTVGEVRGTIEIGNALDKRIVVSLACAKLLSWLYLYCALLRHYLMGNAQVFAYSLLLVPSASQRHTRLPIAPAAANYDSPSQDSSAP